MTKEEHLDNSNYDMKDQYDSSIEDDHEDEMCDTFVENIDEDDEHIIDDDANFVFKYRSSTQKLTSL